MIRNTYKNKKNYSLEIIEYLQHKRRPNKVYNDICRNIDNLGYGMQEGHRQEAKDLHV